MEGTKCYATQVLGSVDGLTTSLAHIKPLSGIDRLYGTRCRLVVCRLLTLLRHIQNNNTFGVKRDFWARSIMKYLNVIRSLNFGGLSWSSCSQRTCHNWTTCCSLSGTRSICQRRFAVTAIQRFNLIFSFNFNCRCVIVNQSVDSGCTFLMIYSCSCNCHCLTDNLTVSKNFLYLLIFLALFLQSCNGCSLNGTDDSVKNR